MPLCCIKVLIKNLKSKSDPKICNGSVYLNIILIKLLTQFYSELKYTEHVQLSLSLSLQTFCDTV